MKIPAYVPALPVIRPGGLDYRTYPSRTSSDRTEPWSPPIGAMSGSARQVRAQTEYNRKRALTWGA